MIRLGSRMISLVPIPGADEQADELHRLGGRGDVGAGAPSSSPKLSLVEQRGQRGEADERGGEERQGVEDPAQALDLPHHPPRLGERRRRLLGEQRVALHAHGLALLHAPDRLDQAQAEQRPG